MICQLCNGSGRNGRKACRGCNGHGEYTPPQADTGRFVCAVTSKSLGIMTKELGKALELGLPKPQVRCLARMIARARAGEHPGGAR